MPRWGEPASYSVMPCLPQLSARVARCGHARDDDVAVRARAVEHAAALIADSYGDVAERIDALGHGVDGVLEQARVRVDDRVDRLVRRIDGAGADRSLHADIAVLAAQAHGRGRHAERAAADVQRIERVRVGGLGQILAADHLEVPGPSVVAPLRYSLGPR